MVKNILQYFQKEWTNLHSAAYLLGAFALSSQVLAILRDRLLASQFGASSSLDVYYIAFRIPDFIYVTIASLVSVTVLIPFLAKKEEDGVKSTRDFLNSVFTVFTVAVLLVCLAVFLFMPYLTPLVAPGLDQGFHNELVTLSRLLLLSPLLLGVSNLFGSITQLKRKFFVSGLSPILYNAGIIFGIILFAPTFGIRGVVYGVIFGAVLHLAIQVPQAIKSGLLPNFTCHVSLSEVKKVVMTSFPRTIALSSTHFTLLVLIALASLVSVGAVSIFSLSYNIQSVPLAIVGVSYSIAAFPTLSRLFSRGQRKEFVAEMMVALRHIVFWSVPVLVLFIVLRAQIVRTILGSGAFGWTETRLAAASLALFAVSAAAQSAVLLFSRGYYAAGKTSRPLMVNIVSAFVTIGVGYGLLKAFEFVPFFKYFMEALLKVEGLTGTALLALPLAFSIGMMINVFLYVYFFRRDFKVTFGSIHRGVFHVTSASVVMGFVANRLLRVFDNVFDIQTFWGIFLQGAFSGVLGISVGVGVLWVLGNKEVREVARTLHAKFWKTKNVVVPTQSDL